MFSGRYRLLLLLLLLSSAAFMASSSPLWQQKIAPELLAVLENGQEQEVLIVLSRKADLHFAHSIKGKEAKARWVYNTLLQTARESQQPVRSLLTRHGRPFRAFYLVNAVYTRIDLPLARLLAADPAVASIQPNPWTPFDAPLREQPTGQGRVLLEWGVERINADDVWALGFNGQGVVVGGQDTGYAWDHPAIRNQYRGWNGTEADHHYNWHDAIHAISPLHGDTTLNPASNPCGLSIPVPCDDNNHGTHTMGTMVGDDGQGNQIGVAPGAKWVGVRNMERGWGSPASYIESFEWFLAPTNLEGENPRPELAPHVINNSWGCPAMEGCNPDNWVLMNQAVEALRAAGTVVVVSAGNSGPGCGSVSDPASIFEASFTVGATRFNDTIAGYSSRGPVIADGSLRLKPDVTAPGSNVRSCIRNGQYAAFSGTSMAGPHVAGAVALLISAVPQLAGEVDTIEAILRRTAVPKFSSQDCSGISGLDYPNAVYGYGRIDVLAAVLEAQQVISRTNEFAATDVPFVSPNPVGDWLRISWKEANAWTLLEVWSMDGRLVCRQAVQQGNYTELSVRQLSAGTYLYRFSSDRQSTTGKFVRN